MKGYVARKGDRWYAVVYEGLDPVTGRERRAWHAAGTDRADAEKLAARLASERNGRNDQTRSLSFGAYLTRQWLPGKRVVLAASTYAGYHRNVERHILPALGRVPLRGLRPHHLEALYERLLHPVDGSVGLAPKTVYEVHLVIRGALADAVRRGLLVRNVALVAHAPRLRSIPKVEQQAWTADELQAFLRAAAGHRLFAALWVAAFTGMRRSELLGLRWDDFDAAKATLSINRGLVAIGYELTETRGKTRNARRRIDLDATTIDVLTAWRDWQHTEQRAVDIEPSDRMFTDGHGTVVHPHAISQAFERIARRAGMRVIRLHDLRHTHGTLLIAAGVPVKVVSERLGHANPTFTIETYQHVLPGMQADAARVFERLIVPGVLPAEPKPVEGREKHRKKTA
ncbi:MAG: tyrosine-type recombinase/integrase [Acidimicrobiales bacterium]